VEDGGVMHAKQVRPWWHLAWFGWCYVAVVGTLAVVAFTSPASNTNTSAFLALPLLTLPLGVIATLPAYSLPSLAGILFGIEVDSGATVPVGIAFTGVWLVTAWANAQAAQVTCRLLCRHKAQSGAARASRGSS
jgi:hypothetical protein